jgi:hypothetical protein
VSRTGVTGATGVVQFANIPGGSYFATATKPGSAGGQAGPINLANGQTLTQNIFMQPIGIVVVPTEVVGFVAADRGVELLEANAGVRRIAGDRYTSQVDSFSTAGRDAAVGGSEPYAAAARFLGDALTNPEATDEALAAQFKETSTALSKAARDASGGTKTAYQEALAALTAAYLDRVALSNPESLPAERSAEIAATAGILKQAGLSAPQVESAWAGDALKERTGVRSTDAIIRLLQ